MPIYDEVQSGLEGIVAFATEIAEPDRDGDALRYRGVDIEELVGKVPFEQVWGLLVDDSLLPGLQPAAPYPLSVHSGDPRADMQAALAALGPQWGFKPVLDISDGAGPRRPRARVGDGAVVRRPVGSRLRQAAGATDGDRRSRARSPSASCCAGAVRPTRGTCSAIDAYWTAAAEHGMSSSTFTARVIASTGADVAAALSAAVGALSGPLHGGAPARVLQMLDEVEAAGDADALGQPKLDRGERIMGFGHRVYRAEDPRARVLRRIMHELGRAADRGRRGARAGGAGGAAGAPAGPHPRDQHRVLGGGRARLRRGPAGAVHADVRLRARRRLVGPHPRAEARGPHDPPERQVRRLAAAPALESRELTPGCCAAAAAAGPHR